MEINNITRTFYRFLNEGKAESFRDAYYPEIDDYILNKIIEIDPESNGDDVSEWGKLLMKLNPTQSDIEQAGKDISIIAKAANLGKDIPSLSDIESIEDLHYLAVDIANGKGHMSDDEIKSEEESLNCPILFDDGGFRVIEINSPEAAEHYGKGTMWPWAAQGADGGMFEELSKRGSIYVIKDNNNNTLYSLVKLKNRMRITDSNDENVDKSAFPQELISAVMSVNEDVVKHCKEENCDVMNEHVVKGIVLALNENYSKKHVKGNDLKNTMNAICECVTKKSDIDTIVKNKIKVVVESYNKIGKKITTEDYKQILNIVKEGFGDKLGDLAHRVKSKLRGTPEEAAKAGDVITNALVKQLHMIYPNLEQYQGKQYKGIQNTLIKICQMIPDESFIDSILKNVLRDEVDYVLEIDPFTNYRNIQGCFDIIKHYFAGSGAIAYGITSLMDAVKQAVGMNESKQNSTVLKENELHNLLIEAVRKNVQRINEEFDEEYGENPDWWEYGYEPGREGEMEHDFAERDNFDRMRTNKQHREMDALANQRRNDQYFPEEEDEDVRRWINGEDIFESTTKRINERRYSSDMIVWDMCPYCEDEIEVYGSDRDQCCPSCGAHFSLSDEAIKMSITEPYNKGYVVIDGTGAVRGQFERGDYEGAIEYANELAIESGLKASFDVYGVERDGYSDSTIIYSTYDNENELRNMMFNK
jgi:hypothetical protein